MNGTQSKGTEICFAVELLIPLLQGRELKLNVLLYAEYSLQPVQSEDMRGCLASVRAQDYGMWAERITCGFPYLQSKPSDFT